MILVITVENHVTLFSFRRGHTGDKEGFTLPFMALYGSFICDPTLSSNIHSGKAQHSSLTSAFSKSSSMSVELQTFCAGTLVGWAGGPRSKVYFESLGLTVVDLSRCCPCCPKYLDLPEEVFHQRLASSATASITTRRRKYGRVRLRLQGNGDEEGGRGGKWDDQLESSTGVNIGASRRESSVGRRTGRQAESSSDEPAADRARIIHWGNYLTRGKPRANQQRQAEAVNEIIAAAADCRATTGTSRQARASKQSLTIAADEPVSKEPKQIAVWEEA
ncbi:hypothetical protein AVEN_6342-1 [Araneus ventricosus]|uniref:Uncharacterized protein n=1 Tax=Araneus ventricosus TaxID=182803 RepID=A0A4Y2V9K2_ARAVE|nr:hypothetical protein AVEN_6342-1 [Araneus ventricosus]